MKQPLGKLYLVSTPIGNWGDITYRALETLQQVDIVICEEQKIGSRLLKHFGVTCPLLTLNEHNEKTVTGGIITQLQKGISAAVISDCGTPVFADPGTILVKAAVTAGISVIPVPGASSLMAALVCCTFSLNDFYYVGFLPRQSELRRTKLKELVTFRTLLVFYDAPYRLLPVLRDMSYAFDYPIQSIICTAMTTADEKIYRGTLRQLLLQFEESPVKSEFVILLDNAPHHKFSAQQRKKRRKNRPGN